MFPAHPLLPSSDSYIASIDGGEIYFLANTCNVRLSVRATFRHRGQGAPVVESPHGRIGPAPVIERTDAATTLAVDLEPYGSRSLFSAAGPSPLGRLPCAGCRPRRSLDLSGGWTVSFGPGRPR